MGRYNEFIWPVKCPSCGAAEALSFQGYIGLLQWERFQEGDDVFDREPQHRRREVGPDAGLEGRSFWAYGLGDCPRCRQTLWARIDVRKGRFVGLVLVAEPANMYDWGPL
ncbi:hypothetical protein D7X55_21935 [Corallococcus sp. AB049A]|uniref:Uncharacterized protein n=1 Tax=Corallococcus interemptor TaxID=2316720 RepID=A0A3A8PWA4_9BACT|nr:MULTISPECIES: hypothetical protein [Corallococcus]RKH38612.1 hypothetical protein D7Y23_37820 [Corallococcus sp. AB050B]RKH60599.1 hypothetical protein D7X96_33275 [Corallococcus interemptor]RKI62517.1 hypothetical protein D7X55_21935 [Corallococcus sp. AB049A]